MVSTEQDKRILETCLIAWQWDLVILYVRKLLDEKLQFYYHKHGCEVMDVLNCTIQSFHKVYAYKNAMVYTINIFTFYSTLKN